MPDITSFPIATTTLPALTSLAAGQMAGNVQFVVNDPNDTTDGPTGTSKKVTYDAATAVSVPQDGRTTATLTAYLLANAVFNVLDYGADRFGTSDCAAAIALADAAARGPLGPNGTTRTAKGIVYFPAGTYRVDSTLVYTGARWVGDGTDATFIDAYVGGGMFGIDAATGSLIDTIPLSIRGITLLGSHSATTAEGLKLGHNYRSLEALVDFRVSGFGGAGYVFAANNWNLTFYDAVALSCGNAGSGTPAIRVEPSVTDLNGIAWFDNQLEGNGKAGMARGGGLDLPANVCRNWSFYSPLWEGNGGTAEAAFAGGMIAIHGLYLESELGQVSYGLDVSGDTILSLNAPYMGATAGHGGTALRVRGTARVAIQGTAIDPDFGGGSVSVQDTAHVTALGGNSGLVLTVAATATAVNLDAAGQPLDVYAPGPRLTMHDLQSGGKVWETSSGQRTPGTGLVWRNTTDNTQCALTSYGAVVADAVNGMQTVGDADVTALAGGKATLLYTATLTANRTVTLSPTGAVEGVTKHVTRTGGGAFTVDVGGLKLLAQNTWATARHDGSAYRLIAYGTL